MASAGFIYWQDGDWWLGYLEEFPDYQTQGESLEELKAQLLDLYRELTSGNIPHVRRRGELAPQFRHSRLCLESRSAHLEPASEIPAAAGMTENRLSALPRRNR